MDREQFEAVASLIGTQTSQTETVPATGAAVNVADARCEIVRQRDTMNARLAPISAALDGIQRALQQRATP